MTEKETSGPEFSRNRQVAFEPVTFGRYRLIDQISKGGMSDIFLAKTTSVAGFQKPLVIKKLLPHYANRPRYVKRFINEAKTLARLNHSNIVQVTDMGVIDSEYYIAMEYVEGRNVAHIVSKASRSGRKPSLDFVVHIILEVARGLAYAHRRKGPGGENLMLVHQDVNAFNVMVSYEGEVKIIDFGIAQALLDKSNKKGFPVAGKLLYFSPEQIQRKPLDRRVDIYGTGVLFYELLAGERLITHQETVSETIRTILQMDIAKKVENNSQIIPELKPILIRSMALEPENRYPWMEDFIQDVRLVAKDLGVTTNFPNIVSYMKEQFTRELVLDRRRMKKLLTDESSRKAATGANSQNPEVKKRALPLLNRLMKLRSGSFRDVPGVDSAEIEAGLRTIKLDEGRTVFRQGDIGSDVYAIEEGRVKLYFEIDRIRQTIGVLGQGEFFGFSSLCENSRSISAVALDNCSLIAVDSELFMKLMGNDSARETIIHFHKRKQYLFSLLENALLEDSLSRLIHALLFFLRNGEPGDGNRIQVAEISELFHIEPTNQMLKYLEKLKSLGILDYDKRSIQVKDSEKLENVCSILSGRGKLTLKL
ncbi:serine/threonine protein kinase [Desulfomonile tiedjei DSM 6799]|uniref:Serine/threonine protein kinase n=1 Tax=Desulfomonile tiedjei (strain ATCC 49306 / DSM 6799 / DCB-1) TaxID=706587 RepID=I4C0F5_DESTA|nr:serine/threonine protein kinase [Desulfomonile tiedjei DSM 6799]